MKSRTLLFAACICLTTIPLLVHAQPKTKPAPAAEKTSADAPKSQPAALDAKAMESMMAKASTPGPQHERLKKLVGEWNCAVKTTMDPSQPAQETKSSAVVTSLMDGRYIQEQDTGEMMGKPFAGMSITGYDNILRRYVSTWIDNAGTGIMTSQGTADTSGNVITWMGESADPMTGKMAKYRMVTRFIDDNRHIFEMYGRSPDGKESKAMEISYVRKM